MIPRPHQPPVSMIIGTLVLASLGSCSDPDTRLGDLASKVTHDQAQQNQRIAEGTKAVAQGSQHLVEADAQARRELIELQHSLRRDQAEIGQHRDALEDERKAIASQRRTDEAVASGVLILACLSPLILAGISLLGLWREPTREEEGELLVEVLMQSLVELPAPQAAALPEVPPPLPGLPSTEDRD